MRISALLLPLNSSMRQVFFLLLAMAANFAAVPPAAAYWMGGDTGMSLSIGAGNYLLSQQALKSATRSAATKSVPARSAPVPPARPAPDATRFTPTASTAGLDTLVAVYPAAARAQARQGFQQLHAAYPQVARQLDLPLDDVASGLASFLAGSYMAYHNSSLDDAAVKPLAAQLRQAQRFGVEPALNAGELGRSAQVGQRCGGAGGARCIRQARGRQCSGHRRQESAALGKAR